MQTMNNSLKLTQLPPLSLYIHIPWCIKKCPYCDFNSHNMKSNLPEDHYVECLINDLELSLPIIWGRRIQTIFIGGGTPSLFCGESINKLLTGVRSRLSISPFAEISMEINPGTVEVKYLKEYLDAGVNRISFGIQSFNDKHLKTLGRIHNSSEAINAIKLAKSIFTNINLDLIYGLPNQTVDELLEDISYAVSFKPEHISYYNLTIEPNTYFHNNIPQGLPDNDLCYTMQDIIVKNLQKHGYDRYETSAFAKKDKFAGHNLNYWTFGDYLGIGAGAHSKISFSDKITRQVRQKHPTKYMDSVINNTHIIENKEVQTKDLPFEFTMNAFRLMDGLPINLFTERTGLSLNALLPKLQLAQDKQFITITNGIIKPTILGQDFLNDLLMMFL